MTNFVSQYRESRTISTHINETQLTEDTQAFIQNNLLPSKTKAH